VTVFATGRSDFPNQVNNSLGFPGIFRGTLDVRAKTITDEMCIAAAEEMARTAEEKGLSADYIMPTMDDVDVFPREAAAVAMRAIEQGIAKFTDMTFEQEYENAKAIILRARGMVQDAMALGYIEMPHGSPPPKPSQRVFKAVAKATAKKAPVKKSVAKKAAAKKSAKKPAARKARK